MKTIILASSNMGKIKEVSSILNQIDINVIPQSNFNVLDIKETGLTFIENAILKARNCCKTTGMPSLADDSGIEVDALKGQPGIYSARYAGISATNDENINKLLTEMKDVKKNKRTARYQCCMVFLKHENDLSPLIAQASWEGVILEEKHGDLGFGYDPVFYIPILNKTASQITLELKNKLSHRSLALLKLVNLLKKHE